MDVKTCTTCSNTYSIDSFYKSKRRSAYESQCKSCRKKKIAEWAKNNPETRRRIAREWQAKNKIRRKERDAEAYYTNKAIGKNHGNHLKRKYWPDLTWQEAAAQYMLLGEKQQWKCAICRKHDYRNLCVDHNHTTGKIRGLLCNTCNRGIGYLQDDRDVCFSAYRYLKRYR